MTWRGHDELAIDPDGRWRPVYVGSSVTLGACLTPAASIDSSAWRAVLVIDDDTGIPQPPVARRGATLCFARGMAQVVSGTFRVCLRLVDQAGSRELDCGLVELRSAQEPEKPRLAEILSLPDAAARHTKLVELSRDAQARSLYSLAVRAQLIDAHFERQRGDSAEFTLTHEPPTGWRDAAVATSLVAQLDYENAMRALARNELDQAFALARRAHGGFQRTADPKAIVAATREAHVLHLVGAGREAQQRLSAAIAACHTGCQPALVRDARNALAWWLINDPRSDARARDQARTLLRDALVNTVGLDRANVLLNLAFLDQQEGRDGGHLNDADTLLASFDGERARQLKQWSRLLALTAGSQVQTEEGLTRLANDARSAALAVQAWRALGQRLSARGDDSKAYDALARAVGAHEPLSLSDQWLRPTPGQRTDDVQRLALAQVRLGRSDAAWTTLAGLDDQHKPRPSSCPADVSASLLQRLGDVEQDLAALERPVSSARLVQSAGIREDLMREQRDVLRRYRACRGSAPAAAAPDVRAFAVDDQLVVLTRQGAQVRTAHIGPLDTTLLHTAIDDIDRHMRQGAVTDTKWRTASAPLARVLAPLSTALLVGSDAVPRRVVLHGILLRVRLSALPLGDGWLSDHVTLVHALPTQRREPAPERAGEALFVVDPLNDLPSGAQSAKRYARALPAATVLHGAAATQAEVVRRLSASDLLHVDAHGAADAGFEDLFSLRVADGRLAAHRLIAAATHLSFANMSGCGTAGGAFAADAGQWGLAGQFVRAGVPWVVGARGDLDDAAAAAFNTVFYEHYPAKTDAPEAYRLATRALRDAYPASIWSALMLLGGQGGQSEVARTPSGLEHAQRGET